MNTLTRRSPVVLAMLALAAGLSACAHRGAVVTTPSTSTPAPRGTVERGVASWYGHPYHGRRTASGEVYDMHRMTAAHKSLPFGTRVRVTRRDTGRKVEVRINDRGPFVKGRIIDLSRAAAEVIGLDVDGIAPVEVRILGVSPPPPPADGPPTDVSQPECFWIQVGAFADEANALRVREHLEGEGFTVVTLEAPGPLYRVRVGPLNDRKAGESILSRVRRLYPPAAIVDCG